MPTPRFVILHHRTSDSEHWDLMLEVGEVLATWQLAAEPTGPDVLPIDAGRIGNHRKAYLEYEGPLSGNRGDVIRVDTGAFRLIHCDEARWELELHGRRLSGGFALVRVSDGEAWQFIQPRRV